MKYLALIALVLVFGVAHAEGVDKCPNLEGYQRWIPDNRHLVDGQCVLNVSPVVEPPATPPVEPPAPTEAPTTPVVESHGGGNSTIVDKEAYARYMKNTYIIDILNQLIDLYTQLIKEGTKAL